MDGLQTLLDNSSTPVLTAFLLGLLTALSPCPLATNIAAIGFIGKEMEDRKRVFRNGLLYTLGRILAYTLLGFVLILILKEGSSMFGIQKTIGTWGERVLGSALFVIGLFMLFGDRLNLPQFGFKGNAEGLARKGGWGALLIGILFALAFCPTSGVLYFGMLIIPYLFWRHPRFKALPPRAHARVNPLYYTLTQKSRPNFCVRRQKINYPAHIPKSKRKK